MAIIENCIILTFADKEVRLLRFVTGKYSGLISDQNMADSESSVGGASQNEAATTNKGPNKGKTVERFINNGEELLQNLAKTVQDLTGPGSTLRTLSKSVKHLEEEIKCLKRKSEATDEESRKKARSDSLPNIDSDAAGGSTDPGVSPLQDLSSPGSSTEANDPSSKSDDIDDFLNQEEEEEESEEEETNLLDDLDQYFEVKTETGPKISDKLALMVNRVLRESPDEEKFKVTKDKHKRPENVDNLQTPTIDNTLWRVLDRQTRAVDLQLQREMGNLARCMVPVLKIIDLLQLPSSSTKVDMKQMKELMKQVKELAGDTFKFMSHFIRTNLEQRKEKVKKEKNLKPRVKSILKETTSTATQLFGDKLKEEMKVLSEKSISLTVDSGAERNKSSQVFLFRKGGYHHTHQRRNQGPPNRYNREQGKYAYNKNQHQQYKKGPGSKNTQKRS
ncbi:MAG: hypothetical protein N0E48_26960 [Candidatus Thiodiazotropha endolucinida]|nr:hypothetical protein [Candidatus Thiodiazotropha taylori]MCW4346968.1 hypothetical protein [Candidatus Thiodiazotropha endolucinida]